MVPCMSGFTELKVILNFFKKKKKKKKMRYLFSPIKLIFKMGIPSVKMVLGK